MAKLTEEQKLFVVHRFACFDSPQQVADLLKQEYGVNAERSHLVVYDHTRVSANKTGKAGKKWIEIFNAKRKEFLTNFEAIPIANKAWRMQKLSDMAARAEQKGNLVLAASLMEQAAKEQGDMFTNTRKLQHAGANGEPLPQTPSVIQLVAPGGATDDDGEVDE